MAESATVVVAPSGFVYKWSHDETANFIKARVQKDRLFTGQRNSAMEGWRQVLCSLGLLEKVTPQQARKKWDNLKKKYKELKCPPSGSGTDQGEDTAASWPFYAAMDEFLGQRHSIVPPVVRASMALNSSMAEQPGPSTSTTPPPPPRSPPPAPPAPKRQRGVRGQQQGDFEDFLRERFLTEERMERERRQASDAKFDRILMALEKIADRRSEV